VDVDAACARARLQAPVAFPPTPGIKAQLPGILVRPPNRLRLDLDPAVPAELGRVVHQYGEVLWVRLKRQHPCAALGGGDRESANVCPHVHDHCTFVEGVGQPVAIDDGCLLSEPIVPGSCPHLRRHHRFTLPTLWPAASITCRRALLAFAASTTRAASTLNSSRCRRGSSSRQASGPRSWLEETSANAFRAFSAASWSLRTASSTSRHARLMST